MNPLSAFFFLILSPLLCTVISSLLSRLKKNFVHMINFFYKNKYTYLIYFLYFLNAKTRYLNYDIKHFFFLINTKKYVFQQYFLNNNFYIFLNNNFQTLLPKSCNVFFTLLVFITWDPAIVLISGVTCDI